MTRQEAVTLPAGIPKKPEWSFYAAWVLLTAICVPVAFVVELLILGLISRVIGDFIYVNGVQHITEDYLFFYTFVPVVGLLTGVLQYLLLRSYLPRMGGWMLATAGGWILGLLLIVVFFNGLLWREIPFNLDLAFLLIGLSLGGMQWLLLRRRLPRAGWWIAATVLGWGLLGWITPGNAMNQYGILIFGLLPACTTAAALALMMRQANEVEPIG